MLFRWAFHLSLRCELRAELSACTFGSRIATELNRRDRLVYCWSSPTPRHAHTLPNYACARVVRHG